MDQASKKRKIFDGRYEIISIVGRGSASVVYRAKHISAPQTEVALKVLINKEDGTPSSDRLRREALAMVSSRHKHVIRLDDFHSVDKICYLAMEFAPESDLRAFTKKKGGKLSITQAGRFMDQIAEALSFIHQAGIVHRDIKPDNILVMNERQVRLGDFGVALLPGEETSLEELKKGIGTLDYMAPEVFKGEPYLRHSDVYLFGVTFYEILSGKHPFANIPMAKVLEAREDNNVTHINELVPKLNSKLADIIMKAMAFDPEQRFANGRELYKALRQVGDLKAEVSEPIVTQQDNQVTEPQAEQPKPDKRKTKSKTKSKAKAEVKNKEENQPSAAQEPKADDQTDSDKTSAKKKRKRKRKRRRKKTSDSIQTETAEQNSQAQSKEQGPAEIPSPVLNLNKQEQEEPAKAEQGIEAPIEKEEESKPVEAQQPEVTPVIEPEVVEDTPETSIESKSQKTMKPHKVAGSSFLASALDSGVGSSEPTDGPQDVGVEQPSDFTYEPKRDSRLDPASGIKPATKSFKKDALRPKKKSSNIFSISNIITLLVIAAVGYYYLGGEPSEEVTTTSQGSFLSSLTDSGDIIPPVSDELTSFPQLPAGMYTGLLSGFIPKFPVPIILVSEPNSNELTVVIGVEGWNPTTISLANNDSNSIKVKSQGFLFTLTGEVQDGKIVGSFVNMITKEQGQWRVQAVR